MDVRIQDSRVHLSRMRQIGSGYQPMDEDTLVCNEEVSKDPLDGIATLNDSAKGRLYCVKLDAGKTARSTKVHVPKQVAAEENDVIVLQNNGAAAQRIYSAYSEGRLKGSYAEFSSAVQAAYDGMGLVTDENDRVVWVRANRSDAKTIRDVQNMAGTVSRYLSDMADGKTTSSDGTELIDARRADAEPDSLLCLRGHAGGGISGRRKLWSDLWIRRVQHLLSLVSGHGSCLHG